MKNQSHHEPLVELPIDLPSEKSTGYVFAGVCAIAAVVFWTNDAAFWGLLTGVAGFVGLAALRPSALSTLNVGWFRFAQLLSKVVTPIVMFVLFAAIIVPSGLIMQFCRDPLQRRRNDTRQSYWIHRDPNANQSSMREQF